MYHSEIYKRLSEIRSLKKGRAKSRGFWVREREERKKKKKKGEGEGESEGAGWRRRTRGWGAIEVKGENKNNGPHLEAGRSDWARANKEFSNARR